MFSVSWLLVTIDNQNWEMAAENLQGLVDEGGNEVLKGAAFFAFAGYHGRFRAESLQGRSRAWRCSSVRGLYGSGLRLYGLNESHLH